LKWRKIFHQILPTYVPRNVNKDQLALLSGPGGAVEIESNFSGGHIKALTAYYGELIAQS